MIVVGLESHRRHYRHRSAGTGFIFEDYFFNVFILLGICGPRLPGRAAQDVESVCECVDEVLVAGIVPLESWVWSRAD